jgi:hypothetical protein
MRHKVARALRKLADLIDPRVAPSPEVTVVIRCEVDGFIEAVKRAQDALSGLVGILPVRR